MKNKCIDAGREGCPCALAEYGKCLVCGRLSGGTCEDCNWQGTCIYSLYRQNGRKVVAGRRGELLPVAEVKEYSEDFRVYVVKASKGFCQKAQTAGAYVFVRAEGEDQWHDAPISVLKSEPEKGLLHLGICRCGPKSGSLFRVTEAENREANLDAEAASKEGRQPSALWVRGVYYNALRGLGTLDKKGENALIYAKGIAMAPLRNFLDGGSRYTKWLADMRIFADLDKVGFDFFLDYFGDLPADRMQVCSFAEEGIEMVPANGESSNLFALTSPYYADRIEEVHGRKSVRPTEGNMCCGEGVCGACTYVDELGRTIRRCKVKESL